MGRSFKEIPGLKALPLRFKKGGKNMDEKQVERDELKEVPSDSARKHLRLGDLLRDRNRMDAAIVEYQKATKKGALSPVAFNKLALAFMLNKDLDSALGPLMRARELFPDFVTTYVHLGQIYLERKDYDRSMENFIMANSLNPF
jgi:tetratricopeptide (TPR) repeat protein